MKSRNTVGYTVRLCLTATMLVSSAILHAGAVVQAPSNIDVNGYLSVDKIHRGRSVQAAVVMDIPSGFHVNSNSPLEKFLIPTQLNVEAANGIKSGPVVYPRAILRNLKFSKNKVSVYEGRAILRFNLTVPANFSGGSTELKARLRYQSCNDEVCFPPQAREVTLPVTIADTNEPVRRINGEYFGGRKR